MDAAAGEAKAAAEQIPNRPAIITFIGPKPLSEMRFERQKLPKLISDIYQDSLMTSVPP